MRKRPYSIAIIGWIFIAVGIVALDYHARHPFEEGHLWLMLVRLLAVLGGVFLLYGFNWARWLLVLWIGFHVIVGSLHNPWSLVVHGLLFAIFSYFFFRPRASAFFLSKKIDQSQIPSVS